MDAVEEIKSRLNIEDVVSQYVELKRAGRNFKGLSPFSGERTPSFMVSQEKQIWHDF
jgi:DNA primase